MATEIIVLGGVKVIAQTFQAIAAMVNNKSFFSLLAIAQTIGIVMCVLKYIQHHDLKVMGKWFFLFIGINTLLLTPKTDIVITDLSDTSAVHKIDNVPVGVALPFNLVTSIGYEIATFYDDFFHQPNELQYTKTGLLFGARLIDDSFELLPSAPEMNANLGNLTKSCIVPALQLNYNDMTWEKLLQSNELAKELAKLRSEVLYVSYTKNGSTNYITCTEGVNDFIQSLDAEINNNENHSIKAFLSKYFGINWNKNAITNQAVQSVFENYMMSSSKSAVEIYKQNIYVNALKRSLNHYPASLDGTADLIAITSEQALSKMKLSHLASYRLATEFLPALHTIFLTLLIGIFPIVVMLMFVSELTGKIIINYLSVLGTLMLWPVLFAIFNSIINVLAANQLNGQTFTLSNVNSIQSNVSTLAGAASWVMLSIPFLSMKLFTGLGQQIASAGSYLGNALASATSADASTVSMGNLNWGNMQMQNINGHKVDLNRSYLAGMNTYQTASGGTITRAEDGSIIAKTNMSQLPTNIDFASMISSALSKSTQNIQRELENTVRGMRNSIAHTFDDAVALDNNLRNTNSSGSHLSFDLKKAVSDVVRGISGYTNSTGVTTGGQTKQDTSTLSSDTLEAGASAGLGKFFGIGASAGYSHRHQDTNQASTSKDIGNNVVVGVSANLEKSDSAERIRNLSDSEIERFDSSRDRALLSNLRDSLRETSDSYHDYSRSKSREHNISETATLTNTDQMTINRNYTSEYVQFVYSKLGHTSYADEVLTNAHSPEYRMARENLVQEFVQQKVNSIENGYAVNAANLSATKGLSSGGMPGYVDMGRKHQQGIDNLTQKAKELEIKEPTMIDKQAKEKSLDSDYNHWKKQHTERTDKATKQIKLVTETNKQRLNDEW